MPWLSVDLDETERFVYALACVPGYSGKDVSIGLEPGWLAILAQREAARHKATDAAWRFAAESLGARESATVPEQTFCVMSLPAEVNPVGSIAVLAKGVLGIRMPKARG
jgi:HSP20 family molecular chaperone IbpA